VFGPKCSALCATVSHPKNEAEVPLWCSFFDEDNVLLRKVPVSGLEGEVSGKKGEAVRLGLATDPVSLKKARKIEPGQGEKLEKDE
jgi:hypothetical protein